MRPQKLLYAIVAAIDPGGDIFRAVMTFDDDVRPSFPVLTPWIPTHPDLFLTAQSAQDFLKSLPENLPGRAGRALEVIPYLVFEDDEEWKSCVLTEKL